MLNKSAQTKEEPHITGAKPPPCSKEKIMKNRRYCISVCIRNGQELAKINLPSTILLLDLADSRVVLDDDKN